MKLYLLSKSDLHPLRSVPISLSISLFISLSLSLHIHPPTQPRNHQNRLQSNPIQPNQTRQTFLSLTSFVKPNTCHRSISTYHESVEFVSTNLALGQERLGQTLKADSPSLVYGVCDTSIHPHSVLETLWQNNH